MKPFITVSVVLGLVALSAPTSYGSLSRGYTGTQIFSTYSGDKEQGEPNHCGEPGGASAWFFYQAPSSGAIVLDTKESNFDTVLAVYTGSGTDFSSLVWVTCNNDSSPTQQWSQVTFAATAGTMYFIAVDGVNGAQGTVKLTYRYVEPPAVPAVPESQVVATGGNVELTSDIGNTVEAAYQWTLDGMAIKGATNATLMVQAFDAAKQGKYKLKVKNVAGESESEEIELFEAGAPRMVSQSKSAPDRFKLRMAGRKNTQYIIQCSENLLNWVPLSTNMTATGVLDYEHRAAVAALCRFYRAVEVR